MIRDHSKALSVAVVGSGIAGLSAAWLLSQRHHVTVYEKDERLGGHSNTVHLPEWAGGGPVDTGFIVFNPQTYPNLVALFDHLKVETIDTDMSFGVSLEGGAFEYAGGSWAGLFAQRSNVISPRFWLMLREVWRFYRNAPLWLADAHDLTLDELLDQKGFTRVVRDDHLYPMAAAIWSTPAKDIGRKPAAAFIRFCENHGLLKLRDRPVWRTVLGGSKVYVEKLRAASFATFITGHPVMQVMPAKAGVTVKATGLEARTYDHVVIAAHADDALGLMPEASEMERMILGAIPYATNETWLHTDTALMPRRRSVWSSWNYLARSRSGEPALTATYWMNKLQGVISPHPILVSLNPHRRPADSRIISKITYKHPQFTMQAMRSQRLLWRLQGVRSVWFCGAYFGAGFHEDALQSGLRVAEQIGGVERPWVVRDANSRIYSLQAELMA